MPDVPRIDADARGYDHALRIAGYLEILLSCGRFVAQIESKEIRDEGF